MPISTWESANTPSDHCRGRISLRGPSGFGRKTRYYPVRQHGSQHGQACCEPDQEEGTGRSVGWYYVEKCQSHGCRRRRSHLDRSTHPLRASRSRQPDHEAGPTITKPTFLIHGSLSPDQRRRYSQCTRDKVTWPYSVSSSRDCLNKQGGLRAGTTGRHSRNRCACRMSIWWAWTPWTAVVLTPWVQHLLLHHRSCRSTKASSDATTTLDAADLYSPTRNVWVKNRLVWVALDDALLNEDEETL